MLNRYICEVFDEMRKCHETRNYSYLMGLIEEAQSMANRMEAKIQDLNDIEHLHKRIKQLRKEVEELEDKKGDS